MTVPYWRLSAFYFFYFAILGCFLPFWSLYLKQSGFDATEIGELTALLVSTKIIAPNLWGWLADKSGKRLRLIRLTSFLSALLFAGFFLQKQFFWFAVVTVSFSFFWNASLPQFEAATLFHLKAQSHRYSRIRLWGSLGFIGAVLGIGRFLDFYSIVYLPAIILSLQSINWLIAIITPEVESHKGNIQIAKTEKLRTKKIELIGFFAVYMLLQVAHGPYYVFYSVYLEQHHYSTSITGQLWALGVLAEICMFMVGGWLLSLASARTWLLLSLALSMGRWLLIAYQVDFLVFVILAQLLHAMSFAMAHLVAIQMLYQYFGEHNLGKGQACYSSLTYGVGGMLGSLYSGYFWDRLGGSLVFVVAALACGLACLIAFFTLGKTRQPRSG